MSNEYWIFCILNWKLASFIAFSLDKLELKKLLFWTNSWTMKMHLSLTFPTRVRFWKCILEKKITYLSGTHLFRVIFFTGSHLSEKFVFLLFIFHTYFIIAFKVRFHSEMNVEFRLLILPVTFILFTNVPWSSGSSSGIYLTHPDAVTPHPLCCNSPSCAVTSHPVL